MQREIKDVIYILCIRVVYTSAVLKTVIYIYIYTVLRKIGTKGEKNAFDVEMTIAENYYTLMITAIRSFLTAGIVYALFSLGVCSIHL